MTAGRTRRAALVALSVGAALVAALSACGGGDEEPATDVAPGAEAAEPAEEKAEPRRDTAASTGTQDPSGDDRGGQADRPGGGPPFGQSPQDRQRLIEAIREGEAADLMRERLREQAQQRNRQSDFRRDERDRESGAAFEYGFGGDWKPGGSDGEAGIGDPGGFGE